MEMEAFNNNAPPPMMLITPDQDHYPATSNNNTNNNNNYINYYYPSSSIPPPMMISSLFSPSNPNSIATILAMTTNTFNTTTTTTPAFSSSSFSSNSNSNSTTHHHDQFYYYSSSPPSYPAAPGMITMDPRIWSRLPHRLLDRILAFLPPPSFFRARSVCKRWYSLLYSSSFLHLYLRVSPRHHWFLFFNHKPLKSHIYPYKTTSTNYYTEGYLLDPYTLTWHRIPFPSIPAGFSPSSSSGGLVCWISDDAAPKSIFLHNPLLPLPSSSSSSSTNTSQINSAISSSVLPANNLLPPTSRPRLSPSVGLSVTNSSLDIVVAGDDMVSPYAVKNLTTETFHVDTTGSYSLWGQTPNSSLPRLCSLESRQMVHVSTNNNKYFYCMNYSPFSVLAYDAASNRWSKIQAPMRRFLRSPSLVALKGGTALVMVAAVEKSKLNVPRSLRMWRLQPCGAAWAEVERMPRQLYEQFAEVEGGRGFDCVGHGEFVVISIRGVNRAVLFDVAAKRWMWMPPCPYVGSGDQLHGFAYDPRLATPVAGLVEQLAGAIPFH